MKYFIPIEYDNNAKSSIYRNMFSHDQFQELSFGNPFNVLNIMNEMWQLYWPYSDNNFLQGLKTDFNQRFFEMYLSYYFLKLNIDLKNKSSGPDIQFMNNDTEIRIECVTPKNGDPSKDDSLVDYSQSRKIEAHDVQINKMVLRFKNALNDKIKYLYEYYHNDIGKGVNIIAVSGCELYDKYSDDYSCPCILKTVYPLGHLTITINPNTMQEVDEYFAHEDYITKSNNSPVSKAQLQSRSAIS